MAESIYRKASLSMIPYGAKEDVLPSIKPTDGTGDFTFSRNADIEATRVNASGLIEKAKVNLLTYSNTFSSWGGSGTSVTSGQSGYDGSSDAWLLDITGGTGSQYRGLNVSATGVHTTSVYAKAGTLNWVLLLEVGGGNCYFDLQYGIVGNNSGIIDASIEAVGATGWYRISFTQNNTITQLRIYPATGNSNVTQTSGNIYIQDAQLNYGLIAQDYVDTTIDEIVDPSNPMRDALVKVQGLTADLPRLDYSGGASCPSLLLEPSRTNVITDSEYLSGGSLTASTYDGITTDTLSPEGVYNANKFSVTTSGADANNRRTYSVAVQDFSLSVYLKGNAGQKFELFLGRDSFAEIKSKLHTCSGEWERVVLSESFSTTSTSVVVGLEFGHGSNDSVAGQEYYLYGLQLEAGSYPTSYIPTYGEAANRGADSCVKTGISSLIGQSEGTLFIDIVPQDKEFQIYYQARTTGSSNVGQIDIRYQSGALKTLGADGGASNFSISFGDIVVGERYKCAVRYAENDVAFYVNGSLAGTDTNASFSSSTKEQITFNENAGSFLPHAEVKQALVFTTALTNAELAALTTI